jgi:hypothetical protein
MSFNRFSIFFLVLLLIFLSATLVFAESEQPNQSHTTTLGPALPLIGTPMAGFSDITSEYSRGMKMDFGGRISSLPPRAVSPDSLTDFSNKYSREPMIFSFSYTEVTKFSISPLSEKFSFNPVTDIRNLEVLLQYKF